LPNELCGRLRYVIVPPAFDQHLGFLQHVQDSPIQELIPQLAVKLSMDPFSEGLPGSMNSGSVPTSLSQSLILQGANSGALSEQIYSGRAARAEQLGQPVLVTVQGQSCASSAVSASFPPGSPLGGGLVDDGQHTRWWSIMCAVGHEVVAPHVPWELRPKPHT
jgi:hypothetical protein